MEPKKQRTKKVAKPIKVQIEEGLKEHWERYDDPNDVEKWEVEQDKKVVTNDAGTVDIIGTHMKNSKMVIDKPKVKSLQELVPEQDGTWEWAENRAVQFKEPVRRRSWPEGDMVFYREAGFKQMKEGMENRGFYAPLTPEFMKLIGVTKFTISSHWNRFRKGIEATGQKCSYLQVGYIVSKAEKEATDWEIIKSK